MKTLCFRLSQFVKNGECSLDVQFDIHRELAGVTVRAQEVGTRDLHLAHGGEHRLGAQLPVVSLATTRTRNAPLAGGRRFEAQ